MVVDTLVHVKALGAKRVYTEGEKQAFLERLAVGMAKAALARGETPAPKVLEAKPNANHESGSNPKVHQGVIEIALGDDKVSQAAERAKKSMAAKVAKS